MANQIETLIANLDQILINSTGPILVSETQNLKIDDASICLIQIFLANKGLLIDDEDGGPISVQEILNGIENY